MNGICKITELDSLNTETLVLLDDELGGICLGIKSEKNFDNIEFKFKKLQFKDVFFGVILLKSDETFYSCFISLEHLKSKSYLEKLINLDYFNLIVFNQSDENKIYRIINTLNNKILFSLPNNVYNDFDDNITSPDIKEFSAETLWNN